jgi:hypothetical protein
MNLFARNTGRESIKQAQTAEPHTARRAVRYAAADNAQAALQRQFPGTSFAYQQAVPAQPVGKQAMQTNVVGVQDDFAQVA